MYKKILFYMMLAGCVTRVTAFVVLSLLGRVHLPLFVVVLSLLIAVYGIVLVVKQFVSKLTLGQLVSYQLAADVGAVISFVAMRLSLVDVSLIETLITGSVLSVLLSVTVLYMTFRRKRYITIQKRREENRQKSASK
ncbi:hypothetical protein [uncultured Negativibacillus sp.]|uniref:hypothetical protein n=1 Tax=uncultured Negativibacillus sp. TaxID=1980696 RepID=UPI0025F752C9|nr:hypothetical protein [uncultured Negativibacillus sp.]